MQQQSDGWWRDGSVAQEQTSDASCREAHSATAVSGDMENAFDESEEFDETDCLVTLEVQSALE